jgi:hypothetical protein
MPEDSPIYSYYMDRHTVSRNNAVCRDFTPGGTQCSTAGPDLHPMSYYDDPALFGRSGLSSGCPPPPCGNQDINAFSSKPRCTPAWSGIVPVSNRSSISELDLSHYTMVPNAWSSGYHGINVNEFMPMRMLQAIAANEKFKNCKNSRLSASSYGSYGA